MTATSPPPEALALREAIRGAGQALGFAAVGFTDAAPLPHRKFFQAWREAGNAGAMDYLDQSRDDPRALLKSAKSLIVVAARYADGQDDPLAAGKGRVARYARGLDYHRVLHQQLQTLADAIAELVDEPFEHRSLVDTTPLLEREAAMRAGVGFIGKNTMLIGPGIGSYTLLGVLALSLELAPDSPRQARCGECRLCLDACPTDAFNAPYSLDSRRCISFLTIENRDVIGEPLASGMGDWVFGCDRCQEVCPYNHPHFSGPLHAELQLSRELGQADLQQLATLRSGQYRRWVKGRAFARTPRRAWRRNALLALANQSSTAEGERLAQRIAEAADDDPLVRTAADHALAKMKKKTR